MAAASFDPFQRNQTSAFVSGAGIGTDDWTTESKRWRSRIRRRFDRAVVDDRPAARGRGRAAGQYQPQLHLGATAQRVPVRIALGKVPPDVLLVAGLTATVTMMPSAEK